MANSSNARWTLMALPLAFPGCAVFQVNKPDRQAVVDAKVPSGWVEVQPSNQGDAATGWLRSFGDPEMERFVAEAIV